MAAGTLMLACLCLAVGTGTAEVIPLNNNKFEIPIRIVPEKRQEIQTLELYASTNQGKNWDLVATATPDQQAFAFTAPADGLYWFSVRVIDHNKHAEPPDIMTAPVGQKILVDTLAPSVKLVSAQRQGDVISVQWEIKEENPDLATFRLEYRNADSLGEWTPVTASPALMGQTQIKVPQAAIVRLSMKDTATNEGKSEEMKVPAATNTLTAAAPGGASGTPPALPTPGTPAPSGVTPTPSSQGTPAGTGVAGATGAPMAPLPGAPAVTPHNGGPSITSAAPSNPPLPNNPPVPPSLSAPTTMEGSPIPTHVATVPGSVAPPAPPSPTAPPSWAGGIQPVSTGSMQRRIPDQVDANPGSPYGAPATNVVAMSSGMADRNTSTSVLPTRQPWGALPPLQVVNNRRVTLEYEVAKFGPSGIGSADLWVTRDDGQNWQKYVADNSPATPVTTPDGKDSGVVRRTLSVDLREEGVYGFYLVVKSGAGLSKPDPRPNEPPQMRLELDYTPPKCRLFRPEPDPLQRNSLIIRWEAIDKNLASTPVSLEWAEQPTGPWLSIGGAALANTGTHSWTVPTNVPPRVFLKLSVRDTAGNVAVAQTPEPVLVDLNTPEVRILGLAGPK